MTCNQCGRPATALWQCGCDFGEPQARCDAHSLAGKECLGGTAFVRAPLVPPAPPPECTYEHCHRPITAMWVCWCSDAKPFGRCDCHRPVVCGRGEYYRVVA